MSKQSDEKARAQTPAEQSADAYAQQIARGPTGAEIASQAKENSPEFAKGEPTSHAAPAAVTPKPDRSDPELVGHDEDRKYGWFEGVKSPDGEDRVSFNELHPDHPGGEAFLAPGITRRLAITPGVEQALREGRIRKAKAP